MPQDDLHLDQKKFAELVVGSHQVSDELDPEAIVKRKLTLYLTAYYMAERFNGLQDETFTDGTEPTSASYRALLKQLQDEKFGDW
ncbi:hypothetical protein [Lacticaseibacillus saniviri]|uniref:Phage protein n=1 Tax=Lacticaseibacillus saniviri JCM 17471 = DSM 24301 TaxID=1293598 RepID=A0A0R2MXN6_9LACO|nr:hypothetical protein [Lacticaseibacillus saniviri]KRO17186.1 hypothetical protein IV56_GL000512 [Lacticaseibacillus saniviri JCM 17471 = DSM 24301]MCG4281817.1 hypothetical protein [Lacticaseibacillus saniviri]